MKNVQLYVEAIGPRGSGKTFIMQTIRAALENKGFKFYEAKTIHSDGEGPSREILKARIGFRKE